MSEDNSTGSKFPIEYILDWKANPISYKLDWINFKLKEFHTLVPSLDLNPEKSRLVTHHYNDMQKVLLLLELIRRRLNDDIDMLNRESELNAKAHRGTITVEENIERASILNDYSNYFYLDVKSFFLWLNIFMDKSVKFIGCLFHNEKPENRSFSSFKKEINKINNEDVKELGLLINAFSIWHNEIKEIRDDNIIHHSHETTAIFKSSSGELGVSIGRMVGTKLQIKYIYVETIENSILMIETYIKELNKVLCNMKDKIPLKVSLNRDDKKGITVKIDREMVNWVKSQITSNDEYPTLDYFIERLIVDARNNI